MDLTRDIAIVGIGGIFPGASDVEQFWSNVLAGHSQSREVPANRWPLSPAAAFDPDSASPRPDKVYSTRGCFVDPFTCDLTGLAISREQLDRLDPMFHLLLHAGKAAWQDTVTQNANPARTGIIIGNIVLPTDASSQLTEEILGPLFAEKMFAQSENQKSKIKNRKFPTDPLNRYVAGLPAAILAKALGISGPAFTLDAACASSLYALKLAVEELLAGRADLMLTGGLSRPDCLYTQMGFSQLHALSPSGRCAPFDKNADGLVVGEGAGILTLKRLADALRDGDHIYATIPAGGIGLSNDIAGNLMQPDSAGQLRAMRAAYQQANWSPDQIDLIECHGTGTPIGDATEFQSLSNLWATAPKRKDPCVIGSVKSNVGHLLTAAGSAGLIKVLLAMRDQKLPPTANFQSPASPLSDTPFTLLQQPADWPRPGDHPRRAAISAFGFGGINAHLLLEQWEEPPVAWASRPCSKPSVCTDEEHGQDTPATSPPIAIVGMATHFGPWQTLGQFRTRIFGHDTTQPTAPRHWRNAPEQQNFKGYFIEDLKIPLNRFRIPPAELSEMLPQQLLMLQVAADAFDDAKIGIAHNSAERLDTGVFIGIGLDLHTTDFRFRWTLEEKARTWSRTENLDLTADQLAQWTAGLRAAAGPPLTANRTMGALGGIVASRIARAFHIGGPSFTLSSEETSALHALDIAIGALQRHEINTALVGAVDLAGDLRSVLCQNALHPDTQTPIGEGAAALILKRHEDALRDGDRIYALIPSGTGVPPRSPSAAPTPFTAEEFGKAGIASPLASLIKSALSLHHQTLPSCTPHYWLHNRADGPRRARISATNIANASTEILLEESPTNPTPALPLPEYLFALSAPTTTDLLTLLSDLEKRTASALSLATLSHQWFHQHKPAALTLSLVTDSLAHLRELFPQARQALTQNKPLHTDDIFFNPAPDPTQKIAFVYPGSGTHFPNMARDLSAHFPHILHRLDAENQHLASQFAAAQLWSNSPVEISPKDAIFAHVSLGTFMTDLLTSFHLTPHAAIGYSLGESTALFSTRTWRDRDQMLARMHASTLFTTDLAGPCNSVRQAWNLAPTESVDWLMGVIIKPAEKVREALVGRDRVYLLIVNTPRECVIGGDRAAVQQLVLDLHARFHPIHGVTTVHCQVAKPIEAAYRELHLLDTTPPQNIRFYSGARGKSYDVTRDSAADSIVAQAMAPFDFTQVIRTAHADGIRLFIEVGPGATCTRMIDQILHDQPHLARSACLPNQNNVSTLLRLLALLLSEGIPLDLSSLYAHAPTPIPTANGRTLTLRTGPDPFQVPLPPTNTHVSETRPSGSVPPVPSYPEKTLPHGRVSDYMYTHASPHNAILHQMTTTQSAHAHAQQSFLRLSQKSTTALAQVLSFQLSLLATANTALLDAPTPPITNSQLPLPPAPPPALDRPACLEFATGRLANVLGNSFAHVDAYPTRVRLPDSPLMLVDRITSIQATPNALLQDPAAGGRLITEHDIHENAWYLDANRIPTCIAVEAGQADLFLSGYLGIDTITKGLAVYRLLDAVVTFHAPLPTPGTTIVYDIAIEHFFRQGDTHVFRFHFDATVNGQRFLTMTKGCAGFFTESELAAGKGIVLTTIDQRPLKGIRPADWTDPVPMAIESYNDDQLTALRNGDLVTCFGPAFTLPQSKIENQKSKIGFLPSGKMTLVHRILKLDPNAGRFALGQITGEADIHPDDWFLTCHFIDDRVMPGTLMYECCLHTLRVYLLRMGWVGQPGTVAYEPIPGIASQLKCRGQVTATTKKVQYQVTLKEIGYQPDGTPYAIADALMSADGKPIVQMLNMSTRLTGLTKSQIEKLWSQQSAPNYQLPITNYQPPLFDTPRITAFALGKPSEAFGDPYQIFDPGHPRKIARLPGPPYQFLDRITKIENATPFHLAPGAIIEAQYDVPPDAWYFHANQQNPLAEMPFSILLEVALQPCGWLAGYLGSALTSTTDLKFRNLGGTATQFAPVTPTTGTLATTVKITNVSNSGGMIIQHFDMHVRSKTGDIYQGNTYFGFFSKDALATQIGIKDAPIYQPTPAEIQRATSFPYPTHAPFPDTQMRMVDHINHFDPTGGPKNLGFLRATTSVNPNAWFFKAHFFEDPVWPGSLGLESFLQLLKLFAHRRWGGQTSPEKSYFQTLAPNQKHSWIYRGQILPTDHLVTIEATITHIDDTQKLFRADGFLTVDSRVIYQLKDFTLTMPP